MFVLWRHWGRPGSSWAWSWRKAPCRRCPRLSRGPPTWRWGPGPSRKRSNRPRPGFDSKEVLTSMSTLSSPSLGNEMAFWKVTSVLSWTWTSLVGITLILGRENHEKSFPLLSSVLSASSPTTLSCRHLSISWRGLWFVEGDKAYLPPDSWVKSNITTISSLISSLKAYFVFVSFRLLWFLR